MDKTTVNRKYSYLLNRYEKSKRYVELYENSVDDEESQIYYDALLRVIEEVLETSIKLNIFILKQKHEFPKTYKESFKLLGEDLDIEGKILDDLVYLAGFRNLLAHEYIDMGYDFTLENVKVLHKVYPVYLKALKKLIDNYFSRNLSA